MNFETAVRVIVELGDGSRYVQTAAGPKVTLGRGLTGLDHCFYAINIEDATVSREHARLHVESDGSFFLEDLGSRNDTFVGGRRLSRGAMS